MVAWGNAQTIASLVIAMLMPILGALADYAGNKIKFFLGFFLTGLVLCLAQAIPMSAMAFLTVYVLCTIGLNSSMTFYDAMLPDITTDERMDVVSSSGYAWGYIGSTVPFIICLALIMGGPALGVPTMLATRLSFVITGAWWLIFTLPLIRTYKQKYGRERGPEDTIGHIGRTAPEQTATLLFHTLEQLATATLACRREEDAYELQEQLYWVFVAIKHFVSDFDSEELPIAFADAAGAPSPALLSFLDAVVGVAASLHRRTEWSKH